jgi:hypothetical protein
LATDAQGRLLSDDGYYYWDGTAWQLVQQGDSGQAAGAAAPTADHQAADAAAPTADQLQAAMNIATQSDASAEV